MSQPCRHCQEAIEPGPTGGWMDVGGFLTCQKNLPHEPRAALASPEPAPSGHRPQWLDGVPTGWCECGQTQHTKAEPAPSGLDAALVTALLGEVGFMRSCIASGERLAPDDLGRQDKVMAQAVAALRASTPGEEAMTDLPDEGGPPQRGGVVDAGHTALVALRASTPGDEG